MAEVRPGEAVQLQVDEPGGEPDIWAANISRAVHRLNRGDSAIGEGEADWLAGVDVSAGSGGR